MNNINENKINIEVIPGMGENLEISQVFTHIPISRPNTEIKDCSKIVIPKINK